MKKRPPSKICTKKKHATEGAAWAAARALEKAKKRNPSKDRAGIVRAYKCKICGSWHVGHWHSREGLIALIDRAVAIDKEKHNGQSL